MKIKNAMLFIDDMSGDPDQDSRVLINKNFTVRDFKDLEQVVEKALYRRLRRNYSEKRNKYNQSLDLFEIYYHYDKTDESSEHEAHFTCEPVIDTDNFKISEKLKK